MSHEPRKRVVVAEDDSVLRNILVERLRQAGYEAYGAEDGEAALTVLKKRTPDLLLLDIVMPKKDGMAVLEEVRASEDPVLKATPVIIISNSGQPVEIERAQKLGIKDFLVKTTFDSSDVLGKVNELFGITPASKPLSTQQAPMDTHTDSNGSFRILVVEDDKFLRELLISKLVAEGYQIESATDGKEAIAALEKPVPHLVLLDLILPDLSGFEILEKMKARPEWKAVPVIVLSNLDQKEDVERATSLGATDFMIKANFSLNEIIARIKKIHPGV